MQAELDLINQRKEQAPRRREIANRRRKLGFDDGGAEEMDDPQIDHIEYEKEKFKRSGIVTGEDR